MKKLKLYLDTSVLGGVFDLESTERVRTAETLLSAIRAGTYEGFISLLTIEEISKAPEKIRGALSARIAATGFAVLDETEESVELARAYVKEGAIPAKYLDDARHLAIGAFHDMDYIVSWNYAHMVNISVRRMIYSVNVRMGYHAVEVVSPEEVSGGGENGI